MELSGRVLWRRLSPPCESRMHTEGVGGGGGLGGVGGILYSF